MHKYSYSKIYNIYKINNTLTAYQFTGRIAQHLLSEAVKMGQTCTRLKSVKKEPDESKDEAKTTACYSQTPINYSPLNRIPYDVIRAHLNPCLTTKDMRLFAATSKQSRAYFHDELTRRDIQKLLEHVVKGEEDQAKAMLAGNPKLLLINTAKTVDYSGKIIEKLTPFQAALCAGDTDMVKMMQPYFDKLDDGRQKMADQIHAVFPEGYDAHLRAQTEATFNFDTIFNAIAHASDADVEAALSLSGASFVQNDKSRSKADNDLTLVEALNRFREMFSQQSLSKTTYNPQHLLKALALYTTTFEAGNRDIWISSKRDVFCRQIIGFCQRFVPACTAQALAQGLSNLVKVPEYLPASWHAERFNRSLKFRHFGGSIYPIRPSCSELGFNYAASGLGGWREFWRICWFAALRSPAFFKKFISIKSTSLCEIISASITPTRDARP